MVYNIVALYRDLLAIGLGWIVFGIILIVIGVSDLLAHNSEATDV